MGTAAGILGLLILTLAWSVPVAMAGSAFTGHMGMHVAVVALAPPLLVIGFGGRLRRMPGLGALFAAPVAASVIEFVTVWAWHAPFLHRLTHVSAFALAAEQASFLLCGLAVWGAALVGPDGENRRRGSLGGVVALLMTSMHMTLLGALIGLSARPLYPLCSGSELLGLNAMQDQHLGAIVMLGAGGAAYLAGGLYLMTRLLNAGPAMEQRP